METNNWFEIAMWCLGGLIVGMSFIGVIIRRVVKQLGAWLSFIIPENEKPLKVFPVGKKKVK